MNGFLWNSGLALLWVAMTAQVSVANLVVGFIAGHLVLQLLRRPLGLTSSLERMRRVAGFVLFFFRELIVANLRVAHDVMTPTHYMRPGVVAVPLDAKTDAEITALANLLSLTPGTLSLDVSSDRQVLYIHAMFVHDREQLVREIKDGFERRLLELLR